MASRQQIKRRITSVKNTKQITRAMQMVAASKLRKAQEAAIGPREYARMAREILTHLRSLENEADESTTLFAERPVKHRMIVLIASDRGLAGAYNSNVIRRGIQELIDDEKNGVKTSLICVGRKAANAAARIASANVVAVYQDLPDHPTATDLRPILNTMIEQFDDKTVDAVDVIYTAFVSSIRQDVNVQRMLPAGFETEEVSLEVKSAKIEPSVDALLASATLRLLEVQLFQCILESSASEHSMRMLSMKNASDNASDIVEDLTLEFNTARQAAITQELAEISGGAEAMNG
jgi:F-type H+-transporting ATPase subunit gamma